MTIFKVRQGDQEFPVSGVEELRNLFINGKIKASDYVYHPVLDKWLYVNEMAELEDLIRGHGARRQALEYNKMSFVFAGFGLLMLFVIPIVGIVLLVIGFALSAMYYAKK